MAKSALAGEMRTKIVIKSLMPGDDADGYSTEVWTSLFSGPCKCKWVNAYGIEVYENMRLGLTDVATLTMRYSKLIDQRCRIWRYGDTEDDAHAYEIVSMDNVNDARKFLEIKVRKKVVA